VGNKVRVLSELTLPEAAVLIQLVLLTALFRLWIPFLSVPRAAAIARRFGAISSLGRFPLPGRRLPWSRLERLADLATRAWFGRGRCLGRSLLLLALLEARGEPASLTLGVRREGAGVAGHAWVTSGNRILADQTANTDRFTPVLHLEGR